MISNHARGGVARWSGRWHAYPALHISEESLHNAIDGGQQHLVERLLRHQPDILKQTGLRGAKSPEFARWLMERGLDPNRTSWLGISPLHRFAMSGDRDLTGACLDLGADINPIDE